MRLCSTRQAQDAFDLGRPQHRRRLPRTTGRGAHCELRGDRTRECCGSLPGVLDVLHGDRCRPRKPRSDPVRDHRPGGQFRDQDRGGADQGQDSPASAPPCDGRRRGRHMGKQSRERSQERKAHDETHPYKRGRTLARAVRNEPRSYSSSESLVQPVTRMLTFSEALRQWCPGRPSRRGNVSSCCNTELRYSVTQAVGAASRRSRRTG